MNIFANSDAPPTDFVAFLAQRGGVSPEAAEHTLEKWFGEYHASTPKRSRSSAMHGAQSSAIAF